MLDFPTTDQWENVRSFVHNVSKCDPRETNLWSPRSGQLLKDRGNSPIRLGRGLKLDTTLFVSFLEFCNLSFCFKLSTTERTPWYERQAKGACHWNDFALEIAFGAIPMSLIDAERTQPLYNQTYPRRKYYVIFSILVVLSDHPRWSVGYPQIENLPLFYQIVKRMSELLDRRCVVPKVGLTRSHGTYHQCTYKMSM